MLIRTPQHWAPVLVATLAMLTLAALDLAGAYAAKEAVTRGSPAFAVLGGVLFLMLFWVYASSLQYVDLGPVTLGWIVILQVGVLLLDHYRYGASMGGRALVAVAVMLAAQAYLMLGAGASTAVGGAPAETRTAAAARVTVT